MEPCLEDKAECNPERRVSVSLATVPAGPFLTDLLALRGRVPELWVLPALLDLALWLSTSLALDGRVPEASLQKTDSMLEQRLPMLLPAAEVSLVPAQ